MDKEIKISISKRQLTYYSVNVIIMVLGLGVGYQLGTLNARSTNTPVATHQSSYIEHDVVNSSIPLNIPVTPAKEEPVSDTSWEARSPQQPQPSKSPTITEPTVHTYRYYNNNEPLSENVNTPINNRAGEGASADNRAFVASKSGTKYYPNGCKSANRIKDENKIYFATSEEAELEGLTVATTCK